MPSGRIPTSPLCLGIILGHPSTFLLTCLGSDTAMPKKSFSGIYLEDKPPQVQTHEGAPVPTPVCNPAGADRRECPPRATTKKERENEKGMKAAHPSSSTRDVSSLQVTVEVRAIPSLPRPAPPMSPVPAPPGRSGIPRWRRISSQLNLAPFRHLMTVRHHHLIPVCPV